MNPNLALVRDINAMGIAGKYELRYTSALTQYSETLMELGSDGKSLREVAIFYHRSHMSAYLRGFLEALNSVPR